MLLHNTDIVSYCATAKRYIELKKRNILMKNKLKLSISI